MISNVLRPLLNFSERFVPYTEHPGWKPLSTLAGLILAVVAALNIPEVRPWASGFLLALLGLLALSFVIVRLLPTALRQPWVLVCMRHHSALFERLLIGSAWSNFVFSATPKLLVSSYKKGSVIDCLQEEAAEHRMRQPQAAGYFVTFDAERTQRLAQKDLVIGSTKYKLCQLADMGIQQTKFIGGYQLNAELGKVSENIMPFARPLFWGLSGVAIKHKHTSGLVGAYRLPECDGAPIVCLSTLFAKLAAGEDLKCPVIVLNWPVLLVNLMAIAKFGNNDIADPTQFDEIKKSLAQLSQVAARADSKLEIFDNPIALAERFRNLEEVIVVGGGTWLPLQESPNARVHPVAMPETNARAYVRYVECFGILRPAPPDRGRSKPADRDAKTIDKWLSEQIVGLVEGGPEPSLTLIGAPCWHRSGKSPASLHGVDDRAARIFDRQNYPDQLGDTYSIFEVS